jgi:hypothetical protein
MNMDDNCNPDASKSLCDGDCSNNMWFIQGKCRLDQLTYDQVTFILQRNPHAKNDLLRVTTDECLRRMALEIPLVQSQIQQDQRPYNVINNPKNTLPFYKLFRGNLNGGF